MSDLNGVIRRAKRRGGRMFPGMYHFRDGSLLVRHCTYKFAHVTFAAYACGVKRGSLLVAALLT